MVTYDFNADSRAIHQGASRASTAYLVSSSTVARLLAFQRLPIVRYARATEPKHSRNNRTRKNETGDQGSICRHLIVCPEWARSTRINKCQGSLRYPFYLPRASFPLFFNPLGEKGKRIYTLGGENLSAAVVDTICVYIFFLLKEKKLGKFIFIIFVAIKIFLLCRNNSSLTNSR